MLKIRARRRHKRKNTYPRFVFSRQSRRIGRKFLEKGSMNLEHDALQWERLCLPVNRALIVMQFYHRVKL